MPRPCGPRGRKLFAISTFMRTGKGGMSACNDEGNGYHLFAKGCCRTALDIPSAGTTSNMCASGEGVLQIFQACKAQGVPVASALRCALQSRTMTPPMVVMWFSMPRMLSLNCISSSVFSFTCSRRSAAG